MYSKPQIIAAEKVQAKAVRMGSGRKPRREQGSN